jgi:hypothetical protein
LRWISRSSRSRGQYSPHAESVASIVNQMARIAEDHCDAIHSITSKPIECGHREAQKGPHASDQTGYLSMCAACAKVEEARVSMVRYIEAMQGLMGAGGGNV